MCGLFGMTLPRHYPAHLLDRGAALTLLGALAEERGRDAAGVAARQAPIDGPERWSLDKTAGSFRRLSRRNGFHSRLATAQTALGHTRWATQGSLDIANASPARAGSLLCTHNGDVDVETIPYAPPALGFAATDSAALFAALATAHRSRVNTRRIVTILSRLHGRAALAWTDTDRPGGRAWLARAGLSPLAVGIDVDGGLWWASNPAWLRHLSRALDLPFAYLQVVTEGTLLSATPHAGTVKLTEHGQFKPTVRAVDQRLIHTAVWRGFGDADQRNDQAHMFHRIAGRPLPHQFHRHPAATRP